MNEVISISSRIKNGDLPKLCRFCFRVNDDTCIDIFSSKIGTNTIIEIVKNYFAIVKKTSYRQYLNGRKWTTEHMEVTNFELNNEKREISCICVDCLKTIIDCSWFGNLLQSQNLEGFTLSPLCTILGNCKLIGTQGDVISEEKIMPACRFERNKKIDQLPNFWDACMFCFKHNGFLLFDIFLSKIMGSSIDEIITNCTTSYKEDNIYEKVHLMKSLKKSITVVDFQWNVVGDLKIGKICLNCVMPLVKIKALIERIRKTNEALPFLELTRKLDGALQLNVPFDDLDSILHKCNFKTSCNENVPSSEILQILKSNRNQTKTLDVITEVFDSDYSETNNPVKAADSSIYCDYCKKNVFGCSSFEDHILRSLNDDVIEAVQIHNAALCNNCLKVVFNKKETLGKLPMQSFKDCSICKLWLFQSRDKADYELNFRNFVKKYFT